MSSCNHNGSNLGQQSALVQQLLRSVIGGVANQRLDCRVVIANCSSANGISKQRSQQVVTA
jgi:hypothetical protein